MLYLQDMPISDAQEFLSAGAFCNQVAILEVGPTSGY